MRKHVFITGAPRSGTTLIKTVLTTHSALAGGDYESTGLFKIRDLFQYSCGEIENGWIDVSCEDATDLIDFYDQLSSALLQHYGGEYFVDKIWPHWVRLKYVTAKFPEAKWVHMVRNGLDSYCSARRHPNIPQSSDLEEFAQYWQDANRLIEREVPKGRTFRLRYEDLAGAPERAIPRVMSFLGLSYQKPQLHPGASGRVVSIRKRKYHHRLTKPIDDRSVERWKTELDDQEYHRFMTVARGELERYGYLADKQ